MALIIVPASVKNFILQQNVYITAQASVSPLGFDPQAIWARYLDTSAAFETRIFDGESVPVATLDGASQVLVDTIRLENPQYKTLDDSVLYAIAASRLAVSRAGWNSSDAFGVNMGSSRGATKLFEKHHSEYLQTGKATILSSPTTTLGNIASWVAQDLLTDGPELSHSITCSTALHALLNGVAWLRSGMAHKFLVGGSEAPLTPFTIAQFKAMKLYTSAGQEEYPVRAFDLAKTKNTMALGEAAAVCCLETDNPQNALALVEGVGYATEKIAHSVAISPEANCFQKSMRMALGDLRPQEVDVIVMHAPGTKAGDLTEFRAIQKVFGGQLPALTTNKWKVGHSFGASGMMGVELALLMIQHDYFIGIPFLGIENKAMPIKRVLVNAVGFGGNAVSILLRKA